MDYITCGWIAKISTRARQVWERGLVVEDFKGNNMDIFYKIIKTSGLT